MIDCILSPVWLRCAFCDGHEHKYMQEYDGEWVTKDTALLFKIMDQLDDNYDRDQAKKAGRFGVVCFVMIDIA